MKLSYDLAKPPIRNRALIQIELGFESELCAVCKGNGSDFPVVDFPLQVHPVCELVIVGLPGTVEMVLALPSLWPLSDWSRLLSPLSCSCQGSGSSGKWPPALAAAGW